MSPFKLYTYNGIIECESNEFGDIIGRNTLHRLDGPAIILHDGNKTIKESWYIDGQSFTKEEFDKRIHNLKLKLL